MLHQFPHKILSLWDSIFPEVERWWCWRSLKFAFKTPSILLPIDITFQIVNTLFHPLFSHCFHLYLCLLFIIFEVWASEQIFKTSGFWKLHFYVTVWQIKACLSFVVITFTLPVIFLNLKHLNELLYSLFEFFIGHENFLEQWKWCWQALLWEVALPVVLFTWSCFTNNYFLLPFCL